MSTNIKWYPIKGFNNYFINTAGEIKNRHGRIMKISPDKHITLRKDKKNINLNIKTAKIQIFNEPGFAVFTRYNFFNTISPKKRGNYSDNEIIFELEIKGKKQL